MQKRRKLLHKSAITDADMCGAPVRLVHAPCKKKKTRSGPLQFIWQQKLFVVYLHFSLSAFQPRASPASARFTKQIELLD
jgi:hypothetical protein